MVFSKHVKIRKEKFGSVIFETLKEKVYVTNRTGSDILKLIEEGKNRDYIVGSLCDIYKGDIKQIDEEVASFISSLKENNLLIE